MDFTDWLPPAVVGIPFTAVALLKIYGQFRGIEGGGCKPAGQRLCGSCPDWSRGMNLALILLFLAIGLGNLTWLAWVLRTGTP